MALLQADHRIKQGLGSSVSPHDRAPFSQLVHDLDASSTGNPPTAGKAPLPAMAVDATLDHSIFVD